MFKLKKIFNKHNNAPELEEQKISYDSIGEREKIYVLEEGSLVHRPLYEPDVRIYYLCCGEVQEFDDSRVTKCFRITPDMIFETSSTDTSAPNAGDKFKLISEDDRKGYSKVTKAEDEDTSDGFFVNVDDWYKTKKVLVRFHCTQ